MYKHTRINKILTIVLLLVNVLTASAQTAGTISGTIKNEQGETLIGAYVQVLETKMKAVTDVDGHFTIKAAIGQTIQASYIGMTTKSVKVTGNRPLDIVLKSDSRQIEEVVVTGYQNIRNRVYTGAASSVKMDDIKLEGIADVSRMLEGRVPGLSIQNISGTFGSAPRINIRGGASIIGNVQPLWVIDGAVLSVPPFQGSILQTYRTYRF